MALSQILDWTGGRLLGPLDRDSEPRFARVSTDTRSVGPDDLFLALRGARFDGHQFLNQAIAAGATGLVVDEASLTEPIQFKAATPLGVVVVPDTLAALQAISAGYRQTLKVPVIGITGSVGKTSTRGMVAACLSAAIKVCQTEANNNNEIGLPKTLLAATPEDQAVILEMGMRGRGEIELLSRIAQPDIALITNIGLAHIERLGSQEEILKAKAEITTGLKPGGLLILNADDPNLLILAHELKSRFRVALVTTKSLDDGDGAFEGMTVYQATSIDLTLESAHYQLQVFPARLENATITVHLPVIGLHMVSNSLFGLAVADALGIDLATAANGAAHFVNTGNRQRLINAGPVLVMDDSYNASPESMLAALATLRASAGSRRLIAALGGMLELGDYSADAHYRVGQAAAREGYTTVLAIGPYAADLAAGYSTLSTSLNAATDASAGATATASASAGAVQAVEIFNDQNQLISRLLEILKPGDALLVKGSRGFAMEVVTCAVTEHFARSIDDVK